MGGWSTRKDRIRNGHDVRTHAQAEAQSLGTAVGLLMTKDHTCVRGRTDR
jgi:hypothetical protein